MKRPRPPSAVAPPPRVSPSLRRALPPPADNYRLTLFIGGATPKSALVIASVRFLCETHLQGRYALRLIDISQQPDLAKKNQIIATPTLIKYRPEPVRRFIGDMSAVQRLAAGLDLRPSAPVV